MTIDAEKVRFAFLNFRSLCTDTARAHIEAGQDAAAGILLVLERRVYVAMQEYALRVDYPPSPESDAPPPPKRRGRKPKAETQAELPTEDTNE